MAEGSKRTKSKKNRKFNRNRVKCAKYFARKGRFGVKSRSKRWN